MDIFRWLKRPKNKGKGIIFSRYRAGDLLLLNGATVSDRLDAIEIRNCSLKRESEEQCFYEGNGFSTESYEEIVGYDYATRGKSTQYSNHSNLFRGANVGRGVSAHSSKGFAKAVKQRKTSKYYGRLYITSDRFVFLCENGEFSFDISLDDLRNITMEDDRVILYSGNDTYCVYSDDCIYIRDLIVLMNMCYEDQQQNETGIDTLSDVNTLWNYGDHDMWKKSLQNYWSLLSSKQLPLERQINAIDYKDVKALSVQEFYTFLHDRYFVWKYTQKNRLATTRKSLKKYITENRISELEDIKNRLFEADLDHIEECLSIAKQIRGLGTAGASGLLAILFPQHFGTVDQFVIKSLLKIEGLQEHELLESMNPESLTVKNGTVLISIMRKQANYLNTHFNTDFWTPRKIDMILWAIDR